MYYREKQCIPKKKQMANMKRFSVMLVIYVCALPATKAKIIAVCAGLTAFAAGKASTISCQIKSKNCLVLPDLSKYNPIYRT